MEVNCFEVSLTKIVIPSSPFHVYRRATLFALAVVFLIGTSACNRKGRHVLEVNYVSAAQATLRDRVANFYNHVGTVKNGERVEVLEREKRFSRVRTESGIEGWIEQRYLVDQTTYDVLQKLTQENLNDPVQSPGVLRNDTNLHITPAREAEHLYQLSAGAKVSVLKRATAEKQPGAAPAPVKSTKAASGPVLEAGKDGSGKPVSQYLCVITEPHDGLPYDYDQIRVFTWNVKKHRYETAYREHGLNGVLPVTVTNESFDKEGVLPVFILHVKDDSGNISERKYKLNTPIVRRVLAPGEQKQAQKPAAKHRQR